MKRKLCYLLIAVMLICCVGCGSNTTTSEDPVINEEEAKKELDQIYENLNDMNEKCLYMASQTIEYWDTTGHENNFKGLWDKNEATGLGKTYQNMRNTVFEYREDVYSYQKSIKTNLKDIEITENLQEYKDLLQEMYILNDTFASVVTEFPDGYNLLGFRDLVYNYKNDFNELKSQIDFLQ